jgi:hypothetical protein
MEFNASAGFRSVLLTIDGMSEEEAGMERASVIPTIKDTAMIIQTLTHP